MKTRGDMLQEKRDRLESFLKEMQQVCQKHNLSLVANDYSIGVDAATENGWEALGDIAFVEPGYDIEDMINFVDGEQDDFLLYP